MGKTGYLVYDYRTNRYDIYFGGEEFYGGLHCGDSFQVKINNEWVETRIELSQGKWYLVGIPIDSLYGLEVKTDYKVYRL